MSTTNISMDVEARDVTGKKVQRLRKAGLLPATVYGKGIDPMSVQVDARTFTTIYSDIGRTTLVRLNVPGKAMQSAFIHDIQRHPVSRDIIHADFLVVDLKVAINTEVPIILTGDSLLVERGDAVVNQVLTTIEVHALPEDVPHHIQVDISDLDSFDKSIYVSDLPAVDTYSFVTPAEEMIVSLTQTRIGESVEDEEEEEPDSAEPALIRKERKEDEL